MRKIILLSLCFVSFAGLFSKPAFAHEQTVSFPLCTNPQGSVVANYDTGSHAIAGQMSLQDGKDTVYAVDGLNQVTQCFCPPSDLNGIQTNWLRADNISEKKKQQLENTGWIFIENGAVWGLADTAYLAQNMSYSCNETEASTPPSETITAVVQSADTTNNNSSNNSSSPSTSPSSGGTPSSLPNTGDSVVLLETIGTGVLSIGMSFLLKKITT